MSALAHLGVLLIRIFGIALATGAVTGGYFLGRRYLDKTLALFSEGRYEAVIGITVATGLPVLLALALSVVSLKRSTREDEQGEDRMPSVTDSSSPGEEYRSWRGFVGALLFVAGSGFLLWVAYESIVLVEGTLVYGENLSSGRRCNWVCWLSKSGWGKWVVVPFMGLIWWVVGCIAVGFGAVGCAWLIASTQRELAGVYAYINRVIRE